MIRPEHIDPDTNTFNPDLESTEYFNNPIEVKYRVYNTSQLIAYLRFRGFCVRRRNYGDVKVLLITGENSHDETFEYEFNSTDTLELYIKAFVKLKDFL